VSAPTTPPQERAAAPAKPAAVSPPADRAPAARAGHRRASSTIVGGLFSRLTSRFRTTNTKPEEGGAPQFVFDEASGRWKRVGAADVVEAAPEKPPENVQPKFVAGSAAARMGRRDARSRYADPFAAAAATGTAAAESQATQAPPMYGTLVSVRAQTLTRMQVWRRPARSPRAHSVHAGRACGSRGRRRRRAVRTGR
jgi:hypothetical protein